MLYSWVFLIFLHDFSINACFMESFLVLLMRRDLKVTWFVVACPLFRSSVRAFGVLVTPQSGVLPCSCSCMPPIPFLSSCFWGFGHTKIRGASMFMFLHAPFPFLGLCFWGVLLSKAVVMFRCLFSNCLLLAAVSLVFCFFKLFLFCSWWSMDFFVFVDVC